ncbi:MAG: MBL fold metallo-hydrolase [Anaerovibrio sp.]|uniref:MBL fold metallo-hydrolase n=1 Tax=Anaerovibrio sp. TaxID=1872532 RepID=UPI0025DE0EE2|nr:MBL fold metallo-hydrolase [Anaerovibrio sp.]MCR5176633.1 MBL fold metallo-hydrolase [Anaerovibrio sp.]
MFISVLASGSKGNCYFIEMEGSCLLVDAGISLRRIKQELGNIGRAVEDLDGIFITHEHSDHVKGLAAITKKYRIPVYSRPDTFRAMSCYNELPMECINPIFDQIRLGKVTVRSFGIPHDAVDPVGYSVLGSVKCVVATDIGFVDSNLRKELEAAKVIVLEANHDIDMLRNGDYPWPLKQRILSNRGHLSNADAAWTLVHLKQRPQKVFLAHLSESNNLPALARNTVEQILSQQHVQGIDIILTDQNRSVSLDF